MNYPLVTMVRTLGTFNFFIHSKLDEKRKKKREERKKEMREKRKIERRKKEVDERGRKK